MWILPSPRPRRRLAPLGGALLLISVFGLGSVGLLYAVAGWHGMSLPDPAIWTAPQAAPPPAAAPDVPASETSALVLQPATDDPPPSADAPSAEVVVAAGLQTDSRALAAPSTPDLRRAPPTPAPVSVTGGRSLLPAAAPPAAPVFAPVRGAERSTPARAVPPHSVAAARASAAAAAQPAPFKRPPPVAHPVVATTSAPPGSAPHAAVSPGGNLVAPRVIVVFNVSSGGSPLRVWAVRARLAALAHRYPAYPRRPVGARP